MLLGGTGLSPHRIHQFIFITQTDTCPASHYAFQQITHQISRILSDDFPGFGTEFLKYIPIFIFNPIDRQRRIVYTLIRKNRVSCHHFFYRNFSST